MKSVKEILIEEFLDTDVELTNTTSLFREKLLDSVDLVQLVSILEENFAIKISPREILPKNFDTIDSIEAYLQSKKDS